MTNIPDALSHIIHAAMSTPNLHSTKNKTPAITRTAGVERLTIRLFELLCYPTPWSLTEMLLSMALFRPPRVNSSNRFQRGQFLPGIDD